MSKKKGLGKGLSALLENASTDITSMGIGREEAKSTLGSTSMLSIKSIETNPFQPRTEFEKEALSELAASIEQYGIIQPLTVRKVGNGKFQLISGERRFRASQIVGLTEVPCYIRIADDQTMLEMALVENIQRENLNPIEVAISYERLIDECNITQSQLSDRVGKNRSTISNYLRLLDLEDEVKSGLKNKKISIGHAKALLSIDDVKKQVSIYRKIISERLSVRRVEELARGDQSTVTSKSKSVIGPSYEQQKLASALGQLLDRKIQVKNSKEGKGKIEIPFASEEDLRKISDLLDL